MPSLKSIEPAETLPVGIFMKHLHGPFVQTVIPVLESVKWTLCQGQIPWFLRCTQQSLFQWIMLLLV
jgi:hypothetical protein